MDLETQMRKFLKEQGIKFRENARSFIITCPHPNCGKEDHCYLERSSGKVKCFKCSRGWGFLGLVSQITHCTFDEARSKLVSVDSALQKLNVNCLNAEIQDDEDENIGSPLPKPEDLGQDFVPVEKNPEAMEYLRKRGVDSPELIVRYDLRYQGAMHGVVFPIKLDGREYGWQARVIPPRDEPLRLVTKPKFPKGRFLLNWDNAREAGSIVLTEGPFDCMKADVPGYTAVAAFGKSLSNDQIELLLESQAANIYIGLDPDAAVEVQDLSELLITKGKNVYRLLPPSGRKDLGECSREEILEALKTARQIHGGAEEMEVYLKPMR